MAHEFASERDRRLLLVAEDDADIRMLVSETLRRAGYAVVEAPDGDEALRLAAEHRPDLAVLDVTMPGRDGFEVARGLGVPVIFLTARRGDRDLVEGFEAGASAYVTKPFDMAKLRDHVAAALA